MTPPPPPPGQCTTTKRRPTIDQLLFSLAGWLAWWLGGLLEMSLIAAILRLRRDARRSAWSVWSAEPADGPDKPTGYRLGCHVRVKIRAPKSPETSPTSFACRSHRNHQWARFRSQCRHSMHQYSHALKLILNELKVHKQAYTVRQNVHRRHRQGLKLAQLGGKTAALAIGGAQRQAARVGGRR